MLTMITQFIDVIVKNKSLNERMDKIIHEQVLVQNYYKSIQRIYPVNKRKFTLKNIKFTSRYEIYSYQKYFWH